MRCGERPEKDFIGRCEAEIDKTDAEIDRCDAIIDKTDAEIGRSGVVDDRIFWLEAGVTRRTTKRVRRSTGRASRSSSGN